MAEPTPTPENNPLDPANAAVPATPGTPGEPTPPRPVPPPPKRHRGLKILGILVAALVLIVLLIPSIASTGAVRSFVLGKVNQNLNGTAEVDSWSIGWTSGMDVRGIRLKDDQGRLIFDCARISTQLSLLDAMRGRYILGNTTIEEPNFVILDVDKDGNTNLQKLAKKTPGEAKEHGAKKEEENKPLPDVQVNLLVDRLRATLTTEGPEGKKQTVIVDPSTIKVNVKSLNDPIEQDIAINIRTDAAPKPAAITLKGTATVAQNNRIDLDQLKADDKLLIQGLDLAAATPFLAMAGQEMTLGGVLDGPLAITASGSDLHAVGNIQIAGFTATGHALQGDTYKSQKIGIPIDFTRVASDPNTTLIRGTLGVDLDQGYIHVVLDTSQQAMDRVAHHQAPGRPGSVQVEVNLPKLAEFINGLHNTLGLDPNAIVTSGQLYHKNNIWMTADKTIIESDSYLSGLAGNHDGNAFTLQPIDQTTDATLLPGGGDLPNLQAIGFSLSSGFAHLTGGGDNLAKLHMAGNLDLAQFQKELGSLIDLSGYTMAGTGQIAMTTDGDPSGASPIKTTANVTLVGIDVQRGDGRRPSPWIKEDKLQLATVGSVQFKPALSGAFSTLSLTTADNLVTLKKVNDGNFVFRTTPGGGMRGVGKLEIAADLKRLNDILQAASAPQVVAQTPAGAELTSGQLAGTIELADAQKSGTALTGDLTVANLSVTPGPNTPAAGQITNEQIKLLLHAVTPDDYSSLQADASIKSGLLNVDMKDARLKLPVTPPAMVASAVATPPALPTAPGTWDMVQQLRLDVDVPELAKVASLASAFGSSAAPAAGAPATAPAAASHRDRHAPAPTTEAAARPRNRHAPAPAATPATAPAVATTQPEPLAPLTIAGGSAHLSLTVNRDQQITKLSDALIQFTNLKLARGDVSYPLAGGAYNGSVKFAMDIAASDEAGKAPLQQIHKISITQLDGDLPLGKLSLKTPLTVDDPGGKSPAANGTILLAGKLQDAGAFLDALQGHKQGEGMPYLGAYTLQQSIGAQGQMLSLDGSVQVTDLKTASTPAPAAKGQAAAAPFHEDKMELTDKVSVDLPQNTLKITTLSLSSASSKALQLSASGSIKDWAVKREFDNVELHVTPDLAQLWAIVLPSMSAEQQAKFAGLKITGNAERVFKISGSFPADKPFAEGIKMLTATGSVGFTLFDFDGLHLEKAELPIQLANGIVTLTTPDGKKASPISCNSGTLDLSGLQMFLAEEHPRVSMPDNTALADKVALNPVLADKLLGNVNPAFLHPDKAGGSIMVKVVKLNRFPIDDLMNSPSADNDGVASIILNIDQVSIVGGGLGQILSLAQLGGVGATIGGSIPNATIEVANGNVTHKMPIGLMGYPPLHFDGKLVLSTMSYDYLNMIVSRELLQKISALAPVTKYLPNDWTFIFSGPVTSLKLNSNSTGQALFKSLLKNSANPANILGGEKGKIPDLGNLLGGGKGK